MPEQTHHSKDVHALTGEGKQDVSGEVEAAFVDDTIIVTMPGAHHCVTYRKIGNAQWQSRDIPGMEE